MRANREPEYQRRIREHATQQQERSTEKERKAADEDRQEKLVSAIRRVEQELNRSNDENDPDKRRIRYWEKAGVIGLWAAAAVGVGAIIIGNLDAGRQLGAFRESITVDQRPWVSLEKLEIAGPLTHDDTGWTGGMRWHVLVKYQVRNYGKTPAAHVNFWGHLLPDVPHFQVDGKWHGSFVGDDTLGACDFTQFATKFGIDNGSLIFPGVTWDEKIFDIVGTEDRFNDIKKYYKGDVGVFAMPLCVTYTSVYTNFDLAAQLTARPSTNISVFGSTQYLTALGYRIGKRSREPFNLNGEIVNQPDIAVGEPGFQANYAK